MKNIKLKMSVMSIIITAVVLACVLVFNIIVGVIMDKYPLKIDLTRDKVYSFSDKTKTVMKNLEVNVNAYAIIPENSSGENIAQIRAYLDKYRALSENFIVSYIDPYENPTFMSKYSDSEKQPDLGSVIIECGKKYEVIPFNTLYVEDYFSENYQINIDMEKKVTNAIMKVTDAMATATVYFTTSHYEDSYTSGSINLKSLLEEEGYECKSLSAGSGGIPEDADILISAVPQADFTAEECEALSEFLDDGGKFILVADPAVMKPMERMDSYLGEWGMALNYDLVIEADEKSMLLSSNGTTYVPLAKISEHTINEKLIGSGAVLPVQQPMSIATHMSTNGSVVTKLLSTSDKAYGKKNLYSETLEKEEGDLEGPLCLAAISERVENKERSSVLVIGSFFAVENPDMLNEAAYLNSDFILNAISYMSGVKASVDIRAKRITPEVMTMTYKQKRFVYMLVQFIIPVIIILLGLVVWIRRRYR